MAHPTHWVDDCQQRDAQSICVKETDDRFRFGFSFNKGYHDDSEYDE